MPYQELKQRVYQTNMDLQKSGLVVLTWGNASGADREAGVMAIKPSGVAYEVLKPADIVVLEPGRFVHDPSRSFSAVRWSSFEGREFSVRVAATYVRGQLAYDGEQIVNQPGDGMFLRPAAV